MTLNRRAPFVLGILAATAAMAALAGLPARAQGPAGAGPRLARIDYTDKAQLSALDAAGWDIWEVHPGYAVAVPPSATAPQSLPPGVTVSDLGPVPPAAFDDAYHTYDETLAALQAIADTHPAIVTLFDIGDGWEKTQGRANRDIWAARVTSRPSQGLPSVLFVSATHAREIATTEVALALLSLLADGYGSDPLITYLVDNRETWIVPMLNPDGHVRAETGLLWRKNANDTNGACYPDTWWATPGIDLNRNFSVAWGPPASSGYACDETYRGPAAFSEPEDLALKQFVESHAFAFTVAYHAYGDLVLYPWGYTTTPPADGGLMSALATKVASYSGYIAGQSTILYATNGDYCDWTWGARGLPCFTIEMGHEFMPGYGAVAGLWNENRPGALYLLNVADDLWRVRGPEVTSVRAVGFPTGVRVQASITEAGNGGQPIAAAECFSGAPGAPGTGVAMAPADGAWNNAAEEAIVWLPPGAGAVYVRGRDAAGNWGSLGVAWPAAAKRWFFPVMPRGE